MKRSEMLKFIEKVIDMTHGNDGTQRLYASDEQLAFSILNGIEQAGMEPPGYEGRIANGQKYTREMGPVDTTWFRGWEPEDETN